MTDPDDLRFGAEKRLCRLIYTSRAVQPVDTDGLLCQAQDNNPARGITGGLALLDGVFLQYLEGHECDVEPLFEKILHDPRHRDVKLLERREIPKRMFADWSMAMLEWTDETTMIFQSFSPGVALTLHETDPSTAAPLFRAWAATSCWKLGVSIPRSADDAQLENSRHLPVLRTSTAQ